MAAEKMVVLKSENAEGRYPKLKDPTRPSRYLKFKDGWASVTQAHFQVIKRHPHFGRVFVVVPPPEEPEAKEEKPEVDHG
jgi:hypothetical protein